MYIILSLKTTIFVDGRTTVFAYHCNACSHCGRGWKSPIAWQIAGSIFHTKTQHTSRPEDGLACLPPWRSGRSQWRPDKEIRNQSTACQEGRHRLRSKDFQGCCQMPCWVGNLFNKGNKRLIKEIERTSKVPSKNIISISSSDSQAKLWRWEATLKRKRLKILLCETS